MKLTFEQRIWIRNYEEARKKGGAHDNDLGWVEFENLPIPDWYTEYRAGMDEEAVPNEGSIPSQSTVADSSTVERIPVKDVYAGSNPALPANFAAELGRRGGNKTKERGIEYYREIGRMGGRGNKK